MAEVAAIKAFGDMCRFGLRVTVHVEPALIIHAIGFDNQGVAVPPADRIPLIRWLRWLGKRAAVHKDLPILMVRLEKDRNHLRSLDNFAGRGKAVEIHDTMSETTF